MATKTLTVALPEDLYQKFIETVTESEGPWRRRYETVAEAIDGAVTAALMLFLQDLTEESAELPEFRDYMHDLMLFLQDLTEESAELPEFRDYMHEKYPELHEDLITMMADLIKKLRRNTHNSLIKERPEPKLDGTGWVKILDWGYTAEVYGRGNDRVMIDRMTGSVIIRYTFREGGDVLLRG